MEVTFGSGFFLFTDPTGPDETRVSPAGVTIGSLELAQDGVFIEEEAEYQRDHAAIFKPDELNATRWEANRLSFDMRLDVGDDLVTTMELLPNELIFWQLNTPTSIGVQILAEPATIEMETAGNTASWTVDGLVFGPVAVTGSRFDITGVTVNVGGDTTASLTDGLLSLAGSSESHSSLNPTTLQLYDGALNTTGGYYSDHLVWDTTDKSVELDFTHLKILDETGAGEVVTLTTTELTFDDGPSVPRVRLYADSSGNGQHGLVMEAGAVYGAMTLDTNALSFSVDPSHPGNSASITIQGGAWTIDDGMGYNIGATVEYYQIKHEDYAGGKRMDFTFDGIRNTDFDDPMEQGPRWRFGIMNTGESWSSEDGCLIVEVDGTLYKIPAAAL